MATAPPFFQNPRTSSFLFGSGATLRLRDLRSLKSFRQDYPEALVRLVYRGGEVLEVDGIRCLPCESFLQQIRPGEPLP